MKQIKVMRPLKAIRAKCLDCSGGSFTEVKLCVIPDCPLYPYRFGRRPEVDEDGYYVGQKARKRKTEAND